MAWKTGTGATLEILERISLLVDAGPCGSGVKAYMEKKGEGMIERE